jgi:hypothetical protein
MIHDFMQMYLKYNQCYFTINKLRISNLSEIKFELLYMSLIMTKHVLP